MTTQTKERLTCTVSLILPVSGASETPTIFTVIDGEPRYRSGPGYIDGMLAQFSAALDLARWQRGQWGSFSRVTFGSYTYLFAEV